MYVIKINKRKEAKFDNTIRDLVYENKIYVNSLEDGYVKEKRNAKHYETKEVALSAVSEEWEMVVKA
jgi:hypothetical protein